MLSMAIIPIESIEVIYREMARNLEKPNATMLKACQELLLMIAGKFPILLTHPGTIDALLLNLEWSNEDWNVTNTLQILATMKDERKAMKASGKKTAASVEQSVLTS
jgi:hypothetical protein